MMLFETDTATFNPKATLDDAIRASMDAVKWFCDDPTPESAESACRELRFAMQLYWSVFGDYREKATTLSGDLESSLEDAIEELSLMVQNKTAPEVNGYLENVQLRLDFLRALRTGDQNKIREILNDLAAAAATGEDEA